MQKAQTLKEEKGILKLPDLVVSKKIDQGTIELVKAIYSDDEYAHQLPGKKDCVSIGMKWYMQKRLILCNLKELYAIFMERFPQRKIGFSMFAKVVHTCRSQRNPFCLCLHNKSECKVDVRCGKHWSSLP